MSRQIDTLQGKREPTRVEFIDDNIIVIFSDGSMVGNPLDWHDWLTDAAPEQRSNYELYPDAIVWPDLDEGLDIEGMLRGIKPKQPRPV